MSNIEKALKKSRKKIKKSERADKALSGIHSKSETESRYSQRTDELENVSSSQGCPDLKGRESQTESKLKKSDSRIMSAIEKSGDEKSAESSMLISEDHDQLEKDNSLVSNIQNTESKKAAAKRVKSAVRLNCGNVDEHIVSYYESIGRQTWKGPVMVHFRRLQLLLSGLHKSDLCKVMVFTSSQQMEGKSIISLNTAVTLCGDKKKKIVLVDCDFRKPAINKLLDFSPVKGLSDYLLEKAEVKDILHDIMMPNLTIVPAGNRPASTCELFSSDKMLQFISYLREQFDFVIIDTPPVLAFPDTRILASLSDGVVFVINSKKARKAIVKRAVGALSDNKLLGFILNQSDEASNGFY